MPVMAIPVIFVGIDYARMRKSLRNNELRDGNYFPENLESARKAVGIGSKPAKIWRDRPGKGRGRYHVS